MKSEPIKIKNALLTIENQPIGIKIMVDYEIVFNEDYTKCWINDSTGRCIIRIQTK